MTATLAQAVSFLQKGRVDEAIHQLDRLADSQQTNAEVFRWLAIACARAGKLDAAQRAIQRAIELNPTDSGVYLTAANIQQDLGRLPAAVELLRQAVGINPAFAEGHNNLGIVLADLGRVEEAMQAFSEAIRLKPQYSRAHANLAAAQLRSLQFQPALASAKRAVALQPDYAHAHHLVGNAYSMLGDPAHAEPALRTALRLKPDLVESSLLLAKVLIKLRRPEEVDRIIQEAMSRSPARAELWTFQGDRAGAADDFPGALKAYQRSLQLRPDDLTTTARAALLLPSVYANDAHLAACRVRVEQGVDYLQEHADVLSRSLLPDRFGDAIPNNFLLAYQGRNDRDIQRKYADFVRRLAERVLPGELLPLARSDPAGRRIRVGFCSRFFYRSTVGNYFSSWIIDLDRNVFEVFVYHTHVVEDDVTAAMRAASDHFYQAEESFPYFLKQIRADKLDILVYPELGMDLTGYLLAALRLAPVQVCGWGHPVTPGHRTIDYYISCAAMEPADAQAHYSERLLLLPGIGTRYQLPRLDAQVATKSRSDYQLPEDAHLYLFPQSLFKIHPDNDHLLVAAMENDAKGVLVMFAGQNQDITRKFVSRLSAAFVERGLSAQGRVRILPGVGHDDYKRINQLCDLMLDTLHWSGGNTSLDALAMGLPIVTLPGEFMRGRQTMAMLKFLGLDELIAQSIDEYLEIARHLAEDGRYREQISQRILANHARLFDDSAPPRVLGQVLERLVSNPSAAAPVA
ncbi:MAG: tetratricopeptide repeat protein [Betaproteobacteria bacterium]